MNSSIINKKITPNEKNISLGERLKKVNETLKNSRQLKKKNNIRKPQVNFLIDFAAFTFFIFLVTTGILLHYMLPPGSGRSTMLGLSRHDWGYLHFLASIGFFAILTIHLFLHWKWISCIIKGKPREGSGFRVGLGVIGLLVLLAFSLTLLLQPVEVKSSNNIVNTTSSHKISDIPIYGSMTLLEVSELTNVPLDYFVNKLNLQGTSDKNKTLGILKKQYGFEINDVKMHVIEYKKNLKN